MAVTNLRASEGLYTYNQYGYTYQYYTDSKALYRHDPVTGNYNLEKIVSDPLEHQRLLDKLQSGVSSGGSTEPIIMNLVIGEPDIGTGEIATFPKLTPNVEIQNIGTIPYNMLRAFTGIGSVPQLSPIIMDSQKVERKPNPMSGNKEFVDAVRTVVQQSPNYFPMFNKRSGRRRRGF
jgi:hypothetical protein